MGVNSNKKRKETLKEVEKIFYPDGNLYDWMGYPIDEDNFPTYHHIVKKSTLKSSKITDNYDIDNCAYLGQQSHSALHVIESKFPDLYKEWILLFQDINVSRKPLSDELKNRIAELQIKSLERFDSVTSKKKVYK